jgi:WD40 repeat protein
VQDEAFAAEAACGPFEDDSRRWRRGRCRSTGWNRGWIGLFLALAILAPWLPWSRSLPAMHPSRRVAGRRSAPIVSLAFGADGRTLATTDDSGRATLWQVAESSSLVRVLEFHGRAQVVAFSFDGHYLAVAGDEPHVAFWDTRRGGWTRSPQIPLHSPSSMKISADGRTLAVSSSDSPEIVLWDLTAGRQRLTLSGHTAKVMQMAFAPDGHSLASATATVSDSPIRIWNVATGRLRRRIANSGAGFQALAYSPDGSFVAGASPHEKAVRIWDVHTGSQVKVIAGHSFATRSVAFSPNGRLLATVAGDGTGGLWSVATGHEIRQLDGEADVLHNVAFSPDGQTLAATANDGDIRLWDVDKLFGAGRDDD